MFQKQRRYTRKRGGSYPIPIKPADTPAEYDLFLLTGHGEITPEFYYVVPENVILLLPNMCGVALSAAKTATSYLFTDPATAVAQFERDFMAGAGAAAGAGAGAAAGAGTTFTVYIPGDILPLHQFFFSPLVGTVKFLAGRANHLDIGFVGLFKPGALYNHPLLNNFTPYPYPNIYSLEFGDPSNVHGQADSYKKSIARIIQYFIASKLDEFKAVGAEAARIVGNELDARLKPDFYKAFQNGDPKYVETFKNLRPNAVHVLKKLLPAIPENLLHMEIMGGKNVFFLNEIVKPSEKPQIYLINTCRSLFEASAPSNNYEFKSDYEPNMTKPSMKLVRTISDVGKKELNMKQINAFFMKKGLPTVNETVIKYDGLANNLKRFIDSYTAETDSEYTALYTAVQSVYEVLSTYSPMVRVSASKTAEKRLLEAAEKTAIEAAAAEKERLLLELPQELEYLKRQIKGYQTDIMYLKKSKPLPEAKIAEFTGIIKELQASKKAVQTQLDALLKN